MQITRDIAPKRNAGRGVRQKSHRLREEAEEAFRLQPISPPADF
jgi:hypothetical protein